MFENAGNDGFSGSSRDSRTASGCPGTLSSGKAKRGSDSIVLRLTSSNSVSIWNSSSSGLTARFFFFFGVFPLHRSPILKKAAKQPIANSAKKMTRIQAYQGKLN
jgi:hypothetical protein